jgi:hypothetical protein
MIHFFNLLTLEEWIPQHKQHFVIFHLNYSRQSSLYFRNSQHRIRHFSPPKRFPFSLRFKTSSPNFELTRHFSIPIVTGRSSAEGLTHSQRSGECRSFPILITKRALPL